MPRLLEALLNRTETEQELTLVWCPSKWLAVPCLVSSRLSNLLFGKALGERDVG